MAGLVDTTRPAHAGRLGYLPGLDGLRAVSIMTVVALSTSTTTATPPRKLACGMSFGSK